MPYKTILVHSDWSAHAPGRIRMAAAIANAEGAHLIGAAMTGVSRFAYPKARLGLASTVIGGFVDTLYERAGNALDQFEQTVRESAVASYERRLISDDPEGALVLLARCSDLVVLSQNDPAHPVSGIVHDLPEYVMLTCGRPVLLVPYAGSFQPLGTTALVAWDGGLEAARALADALPLLRRASRATVACFAPRSWADAPSSRQCGDIAAYLGRQGVKAEVLIQHCDIEDGDALLSLARDQNAGLIVMGGYGHARLRELILGGVTKTVLREMTAPVLMSH